MLSSHAAIENKHGSFSWWRALNPSCIQVSLSFHAQHKGPLFSKVFAAWSYRRKFFLFKNFYFISPRLIPFLPFPSCLAGGHWYLFQTGIKVMGEGWLSAAYPAVALFCLVNGVRHGIRTECWSYPCVRRIKGPKSIRNSERSQCITNKPHFNWLPDPAFWKEERLLLFGIIFVFYRMVKMTLIWVNQTNFDLQIK